MPRRKPQDEAEEIVQLTVRLPRKDWERVSILATKQRSSIQSFVVRGLNLLLEELDERKLSAKAD